MTCVLAATQSGFNRSEHVQTRNSLCGMSWAAYVKRISNGAQNNVIARAAGVDPATVSRWLTTDSPGHPSNVAAFARGYDRSVLEAFVAAGFLTEVEARQRPTAAPSLAQLTDDQLLDEVRTRMRRGDRRRPAPAAAGPVSPGSPNLQAVANENPTIEEEMRSHQESP